MSRLTLKNRLATFLRKHYSQQFIASGELQRIVAERTKYTPQNVGRRLRELENEGVVEVRYEKNHAFYRFKTTQSVADLLRKSLEWFEQLPSQAPN
jgi:DNA-binding transcriptional ArsR family regulator